MAELVQVWRRGRMCCLVLVLLLAPQLVLLLLGHRQVEHGLPQGMQNCLWLL
jgi:hypothetical protein